MAAYIVVSLDAKDQELLDAYRASAMGPVLDRGGKVIAGGPGAEVLEAHAGAGASVIIAFPDVDTARDWFNDPALADLHAMRNNAANSTIALLPEFGA